MPEPDIGAIPHSLEYARRLYENILEWYRLAEAKAESLVALDGIFITVIGGLTLSRAPDMKADTQTCGPETYALLSITVLMIVISVASSIGCLYSRLDEAQVRRWIAEFGVDVGRPETYTADVLWWFGMIAKLD